MPDLTIETMQQCTETQNATFTVVGSKGDEYTVTFDVNPGRGGAEYLWRCDCPGWRYRRRCKHTDEVAAKACHWHQQFGQAQTKAQQKQMRCPECGGRTEWVQVGV